MSKDQEHRAKRAGDYINEIKRSNLGIIVIMKRADECCDAVTRQNKSFKGCTCVLLGLKRAF